MVLGSNPSDLKNLKFKKSVKVRCFNKSLQQLKMGHFDQQSIRKNHSGFCKLFLELLFGLFQVVRLETRRDFQVLFLESTELFVKIYRLRNSFMYLS